MWIFTVYGFIVALAFIILVLVCFWFWQPFVQGI